MGAQKMGRRRGGARGVGVTLAVVVACLLTGCGNMWGYTHPDGSGGGFIENLFRGVNPSSVSNGKYAKVPADAYPGAGEKRIPSDAVKLTSSTTRSGGSAPIFRSPSGNIICQNVNGEFGCGIVNYYDDKPYGSDAGGMPLWWLNFTNGDITLTGPSHETLETFTQTDAVLLYNTSVYSGNIVCGATEKGVTCWDYTTGHGAFMSRESYTAF